MSTGSSPSTVRSKNSRQWPGTSSGTASIWTSEVVPRPTQIAGSGRTPKGRLASVPPRNSTLNL